jgi:DNA modification methylase
LCGDATDAVAGQRLLGSTQPQLMVTDPPYGVEYDPQWRERAGLGQQRQIGAVRHDDIVDWTAAYQLFAGSVAYVWHAGIHAAEVAAGLIASGFEIRAQIIWAKQHFALSRGHYHWQHEPCWYAVRKDRPSPWRGNRKQSTLWEINNLNPFGGFSGAEEIATGHGTQKPVELMRRPILNHTARGEAVYDGFLGSGSTLIAAELTARICYGMEIDPLYVDVIVRRWMDLTGKQATLDGEGRTFQQIAAARGVDAVAVVSPAAEVAHG